MDTRVFPAMRHKGARLALVLGLSPRAARVRRISVSRKLDLVALSERERVLEALANLHQALAALLWIAALGVTSGARPQANAVEALAHIDHHAHDLVVALGC